MQMSSDDTKILEFNQNQKYDKTPFIIYRDYECIIEKIDECKNNRENSSTSKVSDIFYQIFQCLQYLFLEPQKTSMICIEAKIV